MAVFNIAENIYSIGVQNPALRVFDIIMRTEYGTTYNAYLIKNGKKSCLIETVHVKFFEEYLENIRSVLGDTAPDYLIMNHNEPDHSGSIAKLLEVYPDVQIIVSKAGAIYLKNITNRTLPNIRTVTDKETLDLDGTELTFINAPFLHWPDSMFTYYGEKKTLFSCDFLGSHYCEPRMIDKYIKYPDSYEAAFQYYYAAIFSPFKPFVLSGLAKIETLEFDFICPSHGPVLTKDSGRIESARMLYRKWSTPVKHEQLRIPIFYCTAYGGTGVLAKAIADGIKSVLPDAWVNLYNLNDEPVSRITSVLHNSDAFLIGSPTINRDAVAPAWELIAAIDAVSMKDRPCAVFGSFGWSGEGCPNMISRLKGLKMKVSETPCLAQFVPSEAEIENAFQFGKTFSSEQVLKI